MGPRARVASHPPPWRVRLQAPSSTGLTCRTWMPVAWLRPCPRPFAVWRPPSPGQRGRWAVTIAGGQRGRWDVGPGARVAALSRRRLERTGRRLAAAEEARHGSRRTHWWTPRQPRPSWCTATGTSSMWAASSCVAKAAWPLFEALLEQLDRAGGGAVRRVRRSSRSPRGAPGCWSWTSLQAGVSTWRPARALQEAGGARPRAHPPGLQPAPETLTAPALPGRRDSCVPCAIRLVTRAEQSVLRREGQEG